MAKLNLKDLKAMSLEELRELNEDLARQSDKIRMARRAIKPIIQAKRQAEIDEEKDRFRSFDGHLHIEGRILIDDLLLQRLKRRRWVDAEFLAKQTLGLLIDPERIGLPIGSI